VDTAAWHIELREIVASNEYAYAMGGACAMGHKAKSEVELLRRVEVLRALIREHEA
jgi:predicted PP-loop superfamily ATPase